MTYYRLYFFRSETGRIREVREFEAPHDFAAIWECAIWRSDEFMELWSGARKVTHWPQTMIHDEKRWARLRASKVRFPPASKQQIMAESGRSG